MNLLDWPHRLKFARRKKQLVGKHKQRYINKLKNTPLYAYEDACVE